MTGRSHGIPAPTPITATTVIGLLLAMPLAALDVSTEKVYEPVFGSAVLIVEAGTDKDQTVVLVHGLGDAGCQDWNAQVSALAESYLDLAGTDLVGSRASIEADDRSFFIFSLSSLRSPIRSGWIHDVIKLKKDELL